MNQAEALKQPQVGGSELNVQLGGTDGESIVITLFGGTKLAYPASQRNDPNSDYNMLFQCFKSSCVWIDSEERWMGDMPIERIDIVPSTELTGRGPKVEI